MGKDKSKPNIPKLKIIKHIDNVFDREYLFLIGDLDQANKYTLRTLDTELDVDESVIGCYQRIAPKSVIWLQSFNNTPEDISILAHECLHATFDLMEYVGIEYDGEENNEAFTHYLGSLVRSFLKLY